LVKGVGIDIVENQRIRRAYARFGQRFLERIFSPAELAQLGVSPPLNRLAARFAGKEAVYKALGPTAFGIRWQEIEILRCPAGQPEVRLSGQTEQWAQARGITQVHLSLTHEVNYAAACAVAVGES